ncbi:MAG: 50S ribosomal protein L25 [candidate division Zixibacteria bacterium]
MKEITLEVSVRDKSGKGVARKLRAAGKIPAVVYGKDEKPIAIEMEYNDFHTAMKNSGGENLLINLNVDGSDSGKKAIIKELQRDPVDSHLIHIDFLHISMTEKIKVTVPIVLEGTAEGVKNFGGIVSWVIRSVEVLCLPKDIPDKITLDVTDLKIHDSIHVKEMQIENVEILENEERTVVSVIPPTVIKEDEVEVEGEEGEVAEGEAAPAEGEEGAEPEVISEKKAEDRQSGKDDKKGKEEKK